MPKTVSMFVKVPPGIAKKQNKELPPDPAVVASLTLTPVSLALSVGGTDHAALVARNYLGAVIDTPGDIAIVASNTLQVSATLGSGELVVSANAAGGGTIRVRSDLAGITSNTLTYTVTPAVVGLVATSLRVTPGSLVPEEGTVDTITARVLDQHGNVMVGAGAAGHVVTWGDNLGTGGHFAFATTTTDASGIALIAFLVANDDAVNHRITATSPGLTTGVSAIINVQPTPAPPGDQDVIDGYGPLVLLDTDMADTPAGGDVWFVPIGADLQAVLNACARGDIIKLAHGGVWTGNYLLPVKAGTVADGYVWLMTDGDMPAEHSRVRPSQAASMQYPKIKSLGSGSALQNSGAASAWRIMGLEITIDATTATNTNGLIAFGNGDETSLAALPSYYVVDRCYIHGRTDADCRLGVKNNGIAGAVIDCWIAEMHSRSDSNGVGGWNGPGPYKIVNNFIQTSGVSIGSGGAHVYIDGMIPSDFEIRRNHMTKDLSWIAAGWVLKNNLEFKNARRVLVEGNILENSPQNGQAGYSIILWSADQDGAAPWSTCNNVTIRYNIIRNCTAGFQLSARGFRNDETEPMHHLAIHNNALIGINGPAELGFGLNVGRMFQILGRIDFLSIEHNTGFTPTDQSIFKWAGEGLMANHVIQNNVFGAPVLQLRTDVNGLAAWVAYAGANSRFLGNVIEADQLDGLAVPGNSYPGSRAAVGLAGGEDAAWDISADIADLALASDSAYKGTATDGTDPGYDLATLTSKTAGVLVAA